MRSTLRAARVHSGRQVELAVAQRVPTTALGRSPHSDALLRRLFCSGGEKKPPRGFERFYKQEPKAKTTAEGKKPDAKPEAKPAESKGESQQKQKGPGEKAKPEAEKESKQTSSSSSSSSSDSSSNSLFGGPGQLTRQQLWVLAALAFLVGPNVFGGPEAPVNEITMQEMMREYLMKGHVEKIQIVNQSVGRVHLRKDAPGEDAGKVLRIQLGSPETFEAKLEQLQTEFGLSALDHVPIQYVNETSIMAELLPHLPSLLILIPLMMAARSMASGMGGMGGGLPGAGGGGGGRNPFNMGKAFAGGKKDLKSKVKFSDVAGQTQAKKEVIEFVDFLKDPKKYEKLGARVPKGGLLVGPPGTGKTLLAKAVAGEAGCPFYSMSGSDFIEMFVGVGPSRVRDLFAQARSTAPSIIFIDEIDAVGRKRSQGNMGGGGNDERENTLNQMLVEMDGFSSGTGVVVLAGTNRADVLDPALIRPGRFDRQIAIDKPDLSERKAIFMVHLKPVTLSESLDVDSVAQRMAALTPGFAGSDIANICNEAAIFAARRNVDAVEMEDFERATERVMGGLPKQNNLMSKEHKRAVALHESGHAIVGWFLENADPLLKVSIVPRSSGALGFAQYLPGEMSLFSKEAILDKIAVALGGRAAEELFVGKISTGASDDLDKVTKMAYSMVTVYGMNPKLGLLSYNNQSNEQFYKPYSEETGQVIDREAREIVDKQYERVKELLQEKSDMMQALADRLMEKETIVYNDLKEVLGERPFGIQEEFKKFVTASGEGESPFTAGFAKDDAAASDGKASEGGATPPPNSGASSAPSQPTVA